MISFYHNVSSAQVADQLLDDRADLGEVLVYLGNELANQKAMADEMSGSQHKITQLEKLRDFLSQVIEELKKA